MIKHPRGHFRRCATLLSHHMKAEWSGTACPQSSARAVLDLEIDLFARICSVKSNELAWLLKNVPLTLPPSLPPSLLPPPGMFSRPLHRFVAKTVGVTLLAGVCFHLAMDNALNTRAPRPSEMRGEEGREGGERFGVMPGEEEEGREGGREERSGVANQNEAFRRFLMDLEGKDAKTRIEEAAQGMEYFMQPKVGGGGGREGGREGS